MLVEWGSVLLIGGDTVVKVVEKLNHGTFVRKVIDELPRNVTTFCIWTMTNH